MTLYRYCKLAKRMTGLFAMLMLLAAGPVAAQNSFQYQGVITQGAVRTTDNNYYGNSADQISTELTELSLNFRNEFSPNWSVSGQGIYRRAGARYDDADIDYLFVDGSFATNETGKLGFRAGRFKNTLGFYNETRDVAFTRPAVFLPESVYTENFRELLLSTDGLQFYGSLFSDNGEWTMELGAGKPRVKASSLEYLDDFDASLSDRESKVGRIMYEHDGGKWKLALSGFDIKFDTKLSGTIAFPPTFVPMPFTDAGKFKNSRFILSGQYNWKNWQLTGEYNQSDFDIRQNLAPSFEFTNEGYYLMLRRILTPSVSVFYRWERFYADKDDRDGNRYIGSPIPTYQAFRKESVVGARWDIRRNLLLLVDYHYIDGTALNSARENPITQPQERYWHLLAATLSFRF